MVRAAEWFIRLLAAALLLLLAILFGLVAREQRRRP